MDHWTCVPNRIVKRLLLWLTDYRQPTGAQRIGGLLGMACAFGVVFLATTVHPAAAQWCSMPGLTWMTGQVGNIIRGVLFLCGAIGWMFCGTYVLGGRFFPAVATFVIGLVLIALAAGAPQIAGYAMSGGGGGRSLQQMDLGCLW